MILTPLEKRIGNDFQKYRQFRTSSWYEAMKIKYSEKILSDDHAFGFILNAMETQRVEELGRRIWKGMDEEIIFIIHICLLQDLNFIQFMVKQEL